MPMFSSFLRNFGAARRVTIFHSPSSPPSQTALSLLRAAVSNPYPAGSKSQPLEFDLDVEEGAPTADQLQTIAEYADAPLSALVSAHPAAGAAPTSAGALAALAEKTPGALRWPVVVDWSGGRASVGDVEGVKRMLEELRKERDGEAA